MSALLDLEGVTIRYGDNTVLSTRLADLMQREALADLQRVRYAGAAGQGLGTRLQQAFKNGLAWSEGPVSRATTSALPALYPPHD